MQFITPLSLLFALVFLTRIPSEDPSGQSVILSSAQFRRIMVESHVPSEEEKAAALEAQRQAREEALVSQPYQTHYSVCLQIILISHTHAGADLPGLRGVGHPKKKHKPPRIFPV